MSRETGTHVEYTIDRVNQTDEVQILRLFGSKIRALESAVDNGNKVAFVRFGETLPEAIARELAARPRPAAAPVKSVGA